MYHVSAQGVDERMIIIIAVNKKKRRKKNCYFQCAILVVMAYTGTDTVGEKRTVSFGSTALGLPVRRQFGDKQV